MRHQFLSMFQCCYVFHAFVFGNVYFCPNFLPQQYNTCRRTGRVQKPAYYLAGCQIACPLSNFFPIFSANSRLHLNKAVGCSIFLYLEWSIFVLSLTAMTHVGELAGFRNLPIFGWLSESSSFSEKSVYNSLVRSYGPISSIGE